MAVPVLDLNLAPPQTLWRQNHQVLGWALLLAGSVALAAASVVSILAYREAGLAGRNAALRTGETQELVRKQQAIQDRLRGIDVEKELPVWHIAERILSERSLPWSRLTAELERSLVQDVRLKSIQRTRNAAQVVELKLRGEAKSRTAEEDLVESLRRNPFFTQVALERESDRPGGGVEFDYTLSISSTPPPYEPLPRYGPPRPAQPAAAPATPASAPEPAPAKPASVSPAPVTPPPAAVVPAPVEVLPGNAPFQPAPRIPGRSRSRRPVSGSTEEAP